MAKIKFKASGDEIDAAWPPTEEERAARRRFIESQEVLDLGCHFAYRQKVFVRTSSGGGGVMGELIGFDKAFLYVERHGEVTAVGLSQIRTIQVNSSAFD